MSSEILKTIKSSNLPVKNISIESEGLILNRSSWSLMLLISLLGMHICVGLFFLDQMVLLPKPGKRSLIIWMLKSLNLIGTWAIYLKKLFFLMKMDFLFCLFWVYKKDEGDFSAMNRYFILSIWFHSKSMFSPVIKGIYINIITNI